MLIINPIYDQAFKYLMDNEQIAKKVLSIILDQEVISLQSKPNEIKVYNKTQNIPLSRFDFKAIIRTENEKEQNVLIEIQKSKNPDPINRFRRYLGKNYVKKETFINAQGKEETRSLPIITVYFLGYQMPEYNQVVVMVDNVVRDGMTKKEIPVKNGFVKQLTHQAHIIQIPLIKKNRRTRLEKLLNIFDQSNKTEESDFILNIDNKRMGDVEEIVQYLNNATLDEAVLESLAFEEDYEAGILKIEDELEEERRQKEEERRLKENEKSLKEEIQNKLLNTVIRLYRKNFSISEIAETTNLTIEEIEKTIENSK